jgi:hypothetical protein
MTIPLFCPGPFGVAGGTRGAEICGAASRPVDTSTWDHARHLPAGRGPAVAEASRHAPNGAGRGLPRRLWLFCGIHGKFVSGNLGKLDATDRCRTRSWKLDTRGNNRDCFEERGGVADCRLTADSMGASDFCPSAIRQVTITEEGLSSRRRRWGLRAAADAETLGPDKP